MPYDRTQAIIGHGKHIAWSDTLAGTYVAIPGTVDIDFPDRELGKAEITNDDTPDFQKDYIPGLYEPGTLPFTYTYTRDSFTAVEAIFVLAAVASTRASATKFWKITLPDGSTAGFKGFLTKNNLPSAGQEDANVCEAEMQVLGKVTFTAGTGS